MTRSPPSTACQCSKASAVCPGRAMYVASVSVMSQAYGPQCRRGTVRAGWISVARVAAGSVVEDQDDVEQRRPQGGDEHVGDRRHQQRTHDDAEVQDHLDVPGTPSPLLLRDERDD